ncbi:phosphoglycerate kinase [Candidatus Saccharibacteria bacterium]|nr:phosphoglycerate kinase [Candidatus Saccharibacteria bacterium]
MSFTKKTIKDINIEGKKVLVRVDYNVPIEDGKITDDYRIKKSLPTIEYLLSQNCSIVLCSHLGRPDGKVNNKMSLKPVAKRLSEILKSEVQFVEDCVGEKVIDSVKSLGKKQILVLENLRFHAEEEKNDAKFAEELSKLCDVFVQDAFGVVHRAHASTDGVTKFIPSVAGLLLENEVDTITEVMESPKRPLMAIIGGAKISDKIEILNRFIDMADVVVVGGGMANTFLLAEGINIGKSLAEKDEVPIAKEVIEKAKLKSRKQRFIFYIPQDGVVAKNLQKTARTRIVDWDAHVIAEVENYPNRPPRSTQEVSKDELILDIGPFSGAFIAGSMQLAETVVWNGAMGVTETDSINGPIGPFAHGTDLIVDALLGEYGHKPFSVIGGGDTVGYIEQRGLVDNFNHVSTGGGASMELMSGQKLPGVEALLDKEGDTIKDNKHK